MDTETDPYILQRYSMHRARTEGLSDAAIGRIFDLSRARVGQIMGPRGTDATIPAPVRAQGLVQDPQAVAWLAWATHDDQPVTGEDLRAWREAKGLTQVQAAAIMGIHLSTYARWEAEVPGKGCSLRILVKRHLRLLERVAELEEKN
jgi:DNA-binding XRE family transcriptional regulator